MELNHDIGIEEIYLPTENRKDTYSCEDFIVYPEGKEKHGGYLLGIVEMRATPIAESSKVIQTLLTALKDNYYAQISASPDPERLNLETVFEYALQKTNNALTELIELGHINIRFENLHYLIAVAKPNLRAREIDFIFTQQGLVQAYLLHKTKQNNFKVISILDNASRLREEQTDKLKIFSSTLNGKINFHDALYFCSEIFSNYIPAHKVNKILSANDLPAAVDYFKSLVNNVRNNSHLTYCAIFIKLEEKRVTSEQPVSQKSINQLIATEESTEKFLAPNFALNIRNALLKLSQLFHGTPGKLHGPKTRQPALFMIGRHIGAFIFALGKGAFNFFTTGFGRRLKPPSSDHAPEREIKSKFPLRRVSKPVLTVLLVLAIVLVSSLFWLRHRETVQASNAAYAAQITKAKELVNEAQSNLIFKNEQASLTLIKEAQEVIKYLPQATKNQKANYDDLAGQAVGIINKLLHVEKITPRAIATIMNGDQPVTLSQLQKTGDRILTGGASGALFAVNIQNQSVSGPVNSTNGDLYWSAAFEGRILYITNQNKLLIYDTAADSLVSTSINWGAGLNITAIELYNDALYVLDAPGQTIYRWKSGAGGFGERTEWLKNKADADLSQAADLAIDGNLYVAATNGATYKFFTGKKQTFSLAPVEPALNQVKKIYTAAELAQFFVLDSDGKRLAAFNKDGGFVAQYLFETLDNPITDFLVESKTIYFVSGNKVYQANY